MSILSANSVANRYRGARTNLSVADNADRQSCRGYNFQLNETSAFENRHVSLVGQKSNRQDEIDKICVPYMST